MKALLKSKLYVLIWLVLMFVSSACMQKMGDKYIIDGQINESYNGKNVMLFKLSGDSILSVDTTVVKNGSFKFSGQEFIEDISIITIGNYPDKTLSAELILERGNTHVTLDSVSTVTGLLLQPAYQEYRDSSRILGTIWYQAFEKYRDGGMKDDGTYDEAYKARKNYKLRILRANANNVIGREIFKGIIIELWDDSEYDEIYALMSESIRTSPDVVAEIEYRKEQKELQAKRKETLQSMFIDLEVLAVDGKTKRISDYVGQSKLLFIDFWASWCGPCIADMPYLTDTYKEYKDKGLAVLGISIDSNEKAWKEGLKRVSVPWDMVLAKDEGEIKEAYHIFGIPYAVLLDQTGKIIEVNLRGEFLKSFLNQYMDEV